MSLAAVMPIVEIGARLPDNGLLQLMLTAQTGQRGRALFEHRFGMIGGRAHVAIVQSHQQFSGAHLLVIGDGNCAKAQQGEPPER